MKYNYLEGFPATHILEKDQIKSMSPNLAGIPDAPDRLYVTTKSDPMRLFAGRSVIAIVGTRDSSSYGVYAVRKIILTLAKGNTATDRRPVIVSGFFPGIETLALAAALEGGLPVVAVMATGPDTIYPQVHRDFAKRIVSTPGCALITNFAPETAPTAYNFILRSRIIAGLADTMVLVESKAKGLEVESARRAADYGRAVFAVPGRLDDDRSKGCNALICEGRAKMVSDSFSIF